MLRAEGTPPEALMGYRPDPVMPDEMVGANGRVRPHWRALAEILAASSSGDLERRQARAQQYLRDLGVFMRHYGDDGPDERPWPLSVLPVLVDAEEWAELTPGLIQRAELLERVMADLYGPNRLVAEGHLPPALIASNPEWLRPMVGIAPRGGHFLHFLAFEIARGPDGRWWVLADRTQAPSGAGYALENRVATARAFSDLYAANTTHRLAGFFRDFRSALYELSGARAAEGIAILTPGPMSETYYEQAWIARYLGISLVQGEDLSVSRGRLTLRMVGGGQEVRVLWRRLDGAYADPIELNAESRLGTPGLVSSLRAGGVTMINALGSGVLEMPALMAFQPQLCRALLGEGLKLPNIATWWLGSAAARAEVMEAASGAGERILRPAIGTGSPFEKRADELATSELGEAELRALLARRGGELVAQEAVRLSTTPVLEKGALVARPMVLRVFLARTVKGWSVMPGGFARIGASQDPAAVGMQKGGTTADVWVVGRAPLPRQSLTSLIGEASPRPAADSLPSRAADNLFWLGRYIERAEAIMRLLRALHIRQGEGGAEAWPLIEAAAPLLRFEGVRLDEGIAKGLLQVLGAAIAAAGSVRDRFSTDAWLALADLDKTARRMAHGVSPGHDAASALSKLLRKLAGITGLVHENMYRSLGWRFLTLGRLHERAMAMTAALAILADPVADGEEGGGALDLLIEIGDSVMTHRRRFDIATSRASVIDLLALDGANPRSVRHQIDKMRDQIRHLPMAIEGGQASPLLREVNRAQLLLDSETAQGLGSDTLWELRARIARLSDLLNEMCFR